MTLDIHVFAQTLLQKNERSAQASFPSLRRLYHGNHSIQVPVLTKFHLERNSYYRFHCEITGYVSAAAVQNCKYISDCTERVLERFRYTSLSPGVTAGTVEDCITFLFSKRLSQRNTFRDQKGEVQSKENRFLKTRIPVNIYVLQNACQLNIPHSITFDGS